MKYLDEYRDPQLAGALLAQIRARVSRPWVLMEICGGQTHTIIRYGLDRLLPPEIEIVHGPGCPVCVTPLAMLDKAIRLATLPGVTLATYGDMLRVPGSQTDLHRARAAGGDVRVVYSPLDAVEMARRELSRRVVFFAIGFETTAPAHAAAVLQAARDEIRNFSMLVSHVLIPPAIRLLLESPGNRVQGFIAPGHVCTVMGYNEYRALARRFRVPFVVAGFEPLDLLEAVAMLVEQLESGRAVVENQYRRSVRREGNREARQAIRLVFEVCDREWRGLGTILRSGLRLRPEFAAYDAERLFDLETDAGHEPAGCLSAQILQGRKKPSECPNFGVRCTPATPLGAPMVSPEGACAAYYLYRQHAA